MEWFYLARNGAKIGPVAEADLVAYLRRMPDPGATLVWHTGRPDWVPAAHIPGLRALLTAGPAYSPPTPVGNGPLSQDKVTTRSRNKPADDALLGGLASILLHDGLFLLLPILTLVAAARGWNEAQRLNGAGKSRALVAMILGALFLLLGISNIQKW